GPEFQFAHAGHQRHGGAEGAQKAPEKNRPGPETMEEMQAFLQLLFIMAERPDVQDLMVIMKSDPIRDPVAQDRSDHRARPGGNDTDMTGTDHRAQGDQQERSWNDERHAYKRFRKGDDECDGEAPDRMRLGDAGDPRRQFVKKPMEDLMEQGLG